MNGANKILTVSYGTFSCTLEGFDEPFITMKAIAEYFRDLAADDRYFGAEPPTPDAEMLHRIAEREVQRRVEAKISEHGVILRAGQAPMAPAMAEAAAAPVASAVPVAPPAAVADVAVADVVANAATAATVAEPQVLTPEVLTPEPLAPEPLTDDSPIALKLRRIRAVVSDIQDRDIQDGGLEDEAPVPAPEAALAAAFADPEEFDIPAFDVAELAIAENAEIDIAKIESPQEPAADDLGLVPAPHADADDADLDTAAPMMADTAMAGDDGHDMSDDSDVDVSVDYTEDTIAAVLARAATGLTAPDGAQEEPAQAEQADTAPDITATGDMDSEGDLEAWEAAIGAAAADANAAVEASTGETLATIMAATGTDASDEDDETVNTEAYDWSEEDEESLRAALTDDAAAMAAAGEEAEADLDAIVADLPAGQHDAAPAFDVAEAQTEAEELADDIVARELAAEDLGDDADPAIAAAHQQADGAETGDTETDTGAEAEADRPEPTLAALLNKARARVLKVSPADRIRPVRPAAREAELAAEAGIVPEAETEAEAVSDDSSLLAGIGAAIASANTDAVTPQHPVPGAATTARPEPEGRSLLKDHAEDESEVARLMEEANTKLDGAESRRRFSAISHLKAAVAATVADRLMRTRDAPSDRSTPEDAEIDQYRADLTRAVRPHRIDGEPARTTQRPATETRQPPLVLVSEQRVDRPADAAREPLIVRPRRVLTGNLAVSDEDEVEVENPLSVEEARNFTEFAERLGAKSLLEMLEAAAVYTSTVEGMPSFTRPHVLRCVAIAPETADYSREDCLRSFGALLRQGKIQKVRRGQFTLTETSGYLGEAARIAQ